mgnify:CR=1 FL=1
MATQQGKNSSNKKATEKSVTPGYVQLNINARKAKEPSGRVPTMLTNHLYKPSEITLFTPKEEIARDREIAQKAEIFDFLNKNSVFDNGTIRTLYSLCFCLTKDNSEDILEFSRISAKEKSLKRDSYVTRDLPIKEFVRFMFGSRGLHDRAIGVIKDIITLANIPVSWQYEIKDKDGKTHKWRKIAPFINYEIDLPDGDGRDTDSILEDIYNQGTMSITIGRPLLQNLEQRFAYIPKALITEWGKDGTQNELFPILLNELLSLQGNYRFHAYSTRDRLKEEHKNDNISKEESCKIIEEKMKEMLTCRIKFKTIAENSTYDYAAKRRWDRMEDQVRANMNFFRDKISLITEYDITGKGSEKVVVFVFNTDYPTMKELPETK